MKDSPDIIGGFFGDVAASAFEADKHRPSYNKQVSGFNSRLFIFAKRSFDIGMSLALLPLLGSVAVGVAILNLFSNKGSLLFFQRRMGRTCRPFVAVKFRTMRMVKNVGRGPDDPLETDRITRLGGFMRTSRIDELPQILNVLKGEMSLIGPRPDYFDHALEYVKTVPGYVQRHQIRPGISGLAQTQLGYIEGTEATRQKVLCDLKYIREASYRMEISVFVTTIQTVLLRRGR